MGWFGKGEQPKRVCEGCRMHELAQRQLRHNLDTCHERIRRQETTIETLQNVIKDIRQVPPLDPHPGALALERAAVEMTDGPMEEPEEALGTEAEMGARIEEVHMDGWEAEDDGGELGDIFSEVSYTPEKSDDDVRE